MPGHGNDPSDYPDQAWHPSRNVAPPSWNLPGRGYGRPYDDAQGEPDPGHRPGRGVSPEAMRRADELGSLMPASYYEVKRRFTGQDDAPEGRR